MQQPMQMQPTTSIGGMIVVDTSMGAMAADGLLPQAERRRPRRWAEPSPSGAPMMSAAMPSATGAVPQLTINKIE